MRQTSVKNSVCVLAGYVVRVLQNGALKWKKKRTEVTSRTVTADHTLTRGLMLQVQYRKFLENYGRQVLPPPPYSPDMRLPPFDLFPKLKKPLLVKRVGSIEEVSNEVTPVIRRITNLRRPDRNTKLAQTLDRCDKAQWRIH